MTNREDILAKLNELKPWLQKEYAVREIGLFGSYADNSQTDKSDIDILVELEKPEPKKYSFNYLDDEVDSSDCTDIENYFNGYYELL